MLKVGDKVKFKEDCFYSDCIGTIIKTDHLNGFCIKLENGHSAWYKGYDIEPYDELDSTIQLYKEKYMNKEEELNLYKILKGYEGETFYHSLVGKDVVLRKLSPNGCHLFFDEGIPNLNLDGSYFKDGECMLFPSKEQRDWNKWVEEQKPKTPKTWSDLKVSNKYKKEYEIVTNLHWYSHNTPIEKSAIALLKIHQLKEVGYGGNVSSKEWKHSSIKCWCITYDQDSNFLVNNVMFPTSFIHVAFHTKEQAEEFLSYTENVQLLKDYFMI